MSFEHSVARGAGGAAASGTGGGVSGLGRAGRRVTWSRILGLALVPLTVAGLLLWGLWNPQDRLDTVTAAVVNLDEPVELDGQLVPLGRVLAGELIGSPGGAGLGSGDSGDGNVTNFTWLLTNETDAAEGLSDGRYATVVTIPENFSAAATSISGDPADAERATIDVAESTKGRLIDTALSNIVTSTATSVLNQQLGEQFIGGVFVGMGELSRGIGSAADGAHQLASGGTQLADGAGQLADGTQQLAEGTGQLASGAAQLSSGSAELAGGASQLASGASGLAAGASEIAVGARDAANGGAQLAAGVTQYTQGVNAIVQTVIDTSGDAIAPLEGVRAVIALLPDDTVFPDGSTKQTVLDTIDQVLAELRNASQGDPASQLVQLREAGTALAAGTQASAAGQAELATGIEGFAFGLGQYAAGAGEFSAGASQLSSGASELASGTSQLAAQTPELAAGAGALAEGATLSAAGATELATGLDEAASGIPNYSQAERDTLAELGIAPVKAEGESDELFNASGVPLFAGIALWAGALAVFLLLAPLWRRTREAARGVGFVTLRSAVPALLLGAAQGLLVGILLPVSLGYDFAQGLQFFGISVVAGAVFALVVQGLAALLGGFGRFIAFALLVAAFAAGIVSTAPAGLTAIGDMSPIGAALAGFQQVANGGSAAGAVVLLIVWGVGGLALTGLAVGRARKAR